LPQKPQLAALLVTSSQPEPQNCSGAMQAGRAPENAQLESPSVQMPVRLSPASVTVQVR
jgi:hypothetical protein